MVNRCVPDVSESTGVTLSVPVVVTESLRIVSPVVLVVSHASVSGSIPIAPVLPPLRKTVAVVVCAPANGLPGSRAVPSSGPAAPRLVVGAPPWLLMVENDLRRIILTDLLEGEVPVVDMIEHGDLVL